MRCMRRSKNCWSVIFYCYSWFPLLQFQCCILKFNLCMYLENVGYAINLNIDEVERIRKCGLKMGRKRKMGPRSFYQVQERAWPHLVRERRTQNAALALRKKCSLIHARVNLLGNKEKGNRTKEWHAPATCSRK